MSCRVGPRLISYGYVGWFVPRRSRAGVAVSLKEGKNRIKGNVLVCVCVCVPCVDLCSGKIMTPMKRNGLYVSVVIVLFCTDSITGVHTYMYMVGLYVHTDTYVVYRSIASLLYHAWTPPHARSLMHTYFNAAEPRGLALYLYFNSKFNIQMYILFYPVQYITSRTYIFKGNIYLNHFVTYVGNQASKKAPSAKGAQGRKEKERRWRRKKKIKKKRPGL